jgi:transmembrane sensor
VVLGSGEQAETVNGSHGPTLRQRSLTSAQIDATIAWLKGRLVFHGVPISVAVDEINRYNRRKLVIADPNISDALLGGVISPFDSEEFAAILRVTSGVIVLPPDASDVNTNVIRLGRAHGDTFQQPH